MSVLSRDKECPVEATRLRTYARVVGAIEVPLPGLSTERLLMEQLDCGHYGRTLSRTSVRRPTHFMATIGQRRRCAACASGDVTPLMTMAPAAVEEPAVMARTWQQGIACVPGTASDTPQVVFVNTYAWPASPAPGCWHEFSMAQLGFPDTAKAILVAGILIITHGYAEEIGNMTMTFREYGGTRTLGNYQMQVCAPKIGDGPRVPGFCIVPVAEGRCEFQWNRSTTGEWPAHCSYGINLTAQLYVI
jgi:hypothetical protein